MNRWAWLVCAIALLVTPNGLMAQRRGGRGGAGRPAGTANSTDDMKDFKRAIAVQASPEQIAQFRQLTTSTEAARKSSQDFLQVVQSGGQTDWSHFASPLNDAMEDAQADSGKFLQSFSAAQKSLLKDDAKKLGKADSEVSKENKALSRGLERSRVDGKQIAGIAEKLNKALTELQTRQHALGSEMGIQAEASAQ